MTQTDSTITIALAHSAHDLARSVATRQLTVAKGRCAYLNTLALYAVQTYLDWLDIQTDWPQNGQWLFQPTDLHLSGLGHLVCCPVIEGDRRVVLPDLHPDCLGCVVVQLNPDLDQAALLGVVPSDRSSSDPIEVTELESLDALIAHLAWVEAGRLNDLRRWLSEQAPGWQAARTPAFRGRRLPVRRLKQIDLDGELLNLQVQIEATNQGGLDFSVRLSMADDDFLPQRLQLLIMDESGVVQVQQQPRPGVRWLEQRLEIDNGDRFAIQVILNQIEVTESFQLS
jgi:hypothetical protein